MNINLRRNRLTACRQLGFTLIEAMVVLAIVVVLASIALPSYQNMTNRWKVATVAQELLSALDMTKASAIQNNGNVVVSKLTNSEAGLSDACGENTEWSCGWRIFIDANTNGTFGTGDTSVLVFTITTGVSVIKDPAGNSLVANRWGQLANGSDVSFVIFPTDAGQDSPATTWVCASSAGRNRVLKGGATC